MHVYVCLIRPTYMWAKTPLEDAQETGNNFKHICVSNLCNIQWAKTPLEDAQETGNASIVNLLNKASATEDNEKRKYSSMSTGVKQHELE